MKVELEPTTISKLMPGDIIKFFYDAELKYARVLNPEWDGKLHALKIEKIESANILTVDATKQLEKDVFSRVDSKILMEKYGIFDGINRRIYRTYKVKNIKNLERVTRIEREDNERTPSNNLESMDGLSEAEQLEIIKTMTNVINTLRVVYNKTKKL